MAELDHLVVTAPDLDSGCDWVEARLGVRPQGGGEHIKMGTHNRLLRLGDNCYLEVIAINPNAPSPLIKRWFGLDEEVTAPRLSTWVARTRAIHTIKASEALGDIHPMSRGNLNWHITIPNDGQLVLGGLAPSLIEWAAHGPPVNNLAEQGCVLQSLILHHPEPARVQTLLASLQLDYFVAYSPSPFIIARINTPSGTKFL